MLSNVGRLHELKNNFEISSTLFVNVFVHLTYILTNIPYNDWVGHHKEHRLDDILTS